LLSVKIDHENPSHVDLFERMNPVRRERRLIDGRADDVLFKRIKNL
jgi:hypothetical protein